MLWTNPNPTANFAAQDVALSQGYNNFTVIEVIYKYNKTSTLTRSILVRTSDFVVTGSGNRLVNALGGITSSAGYVVRLFYGQSNDTLVNFRNALADNTSDSGVAIPLQINGYK